MTFEDGEVLPFSHPALRDRKRMLYEGAASVSVVMDDSGRVLADALVAVFGMVDPNSAESWAETVDNAVGRLPKKARTDDNAVEEAVRSAVRKAFAPRKPVVKGHIVRVD